MADFATCGKVPYSTRREARNVSRRGAHAMKGTRVYYCSTCEAWHLTSMGKTLAKRVERSRRATSRTD